MARLMSQDGKKIMGTIVGDEFIKYVLGSKHQLRIPSAWAMDKWVFNTIKYEGVRVVRIIDKESGKEYTAELKMFDRHGFKVDRGHGEQIALQLRWWVVLNTTRDEHHVVLEGRVKVLERQIESSVDGFMKLSEENTQLRKDLEEANGLIIMLQVREQDCLRQLEEIDDIPVMMEGYSNG